MLPRILSVINWWHLPFSHMLFPEIAGCQTALYKSGISRGFWKEERALTDQRGFVFTGASMSLSRESCWPKAWPWWMPSRCPSRDSEWGRDQPERAHASRNSSLVCCMVHIETLVKKNIYLKTFFFNLLVIYYVLTVIYCGSLTFKFSGFFLFL